MLPVIVASAVLALHGSGPVPGSAESAQLARWDDSLRAVTTIQAVRRFDDLSRHDPGIDGLRRALFLVRRGELTHAQPDFDQAVYEADFSARSGDKSAWWPYVAARAFAGMELRHWIPIKPDGIRAPDESYGDAAWHQLRIALDRDPALDEARQLLITLLVPGGDRTLRADQLEPLEREVRRDDPDPDALLVWARHLRADRLYDSALAVFNRSASLGGDRSRLDLEEARTLRALHDTVAARNAYWDGLAHVTPAGRELYRYDVAWIVGPDSLAIFDRVPDAQLAGWMRRFWAERDAAAANKPGERLDEHLRRWDVAFARYRVRSPWRRILRNEIDMFYDNADCVHRDTGLYDLLWKMPPHHADDIRDRELLLDHRGIMYLRHGDPIEIIGGWSMRLGREDFVDGPPADAPDSSDVWSPWDKRLPVPSFDLLTPIPGAEGMSSWIPYQMSTDRTESWLYLIDGERVLLNFRGSYAIGIYDATTLSSYLPFSPYRWLARSGASLAFHAAGERIADELLHPSPKMNPSTCWNEVQAAIAQSRADADSATHNDSNSPPLVYPFAAVTRMFALGTEEQRSSKALLTFAMGGRALHGDTLADGSMLYPVHFRIVAWNRGTGATVTVDTVRRFTADRPLVPTNRLTTYFEVPLPAGEWQVAVKATQRDDSAGTFAINRDMRVDRGDALALSDIVTGLTGSPWWTATDGQPFPINTLASWPAGSPVELYYEVHGLAAGAGYRTTVEVEPVDPKVPRAKFSLRIQSTDKAAGPLTVIRRSLGIAQLPAGDYRLTVTVESGGRKVSRATQIMLEKRE